MCSTAHCGAVSRPVQEPPIANIRQRGNRPIREGDVRAWRKRRLEAGPRQARPFGPITVAKAYRLLHAIMSTATDDGLIRRNPCRIKGAGREDSPERPVLPMDDLLRLLDIVPRRYRALVLLATFASLRFGELAALRRNEIDPDRCAVRVMASTAETDGWHLIDDDPKSQAGRRTVAFAPEIGPELRAHLEQFAEPGATGLVFVGPLGGRLRRSTFRRTWPTARTAIGWPGLHFHDLSTPQHDGGQSERQPAGADGAYGPFHPEGGADRPARHQGARRGDRGGDGQGASPRLAGRQGSPEHRARNGHGAARSRPDRTVRESDHGPDLGRSVGAGEGNRTLMTSLEDRSCRVPGELRGCCR
jgi:hypothetical protein